MLARPQYFETDIHQVFCISAFTKVWMPLGFSHLDEYLERERERDEGSLVFTMFSVRLLLHVPMTLPLFEQTIKFKSCTLVKQCHSMQCNAPWHPRTIALEPQKVLRNSSLKVPIPSLLNPRRLPTYSLQSPQSTNPFPESANPFPPQPP